MTEDRIALEAFIEKAPDADFLCEMISFAAERLMALEVDGICGAGHGERNAERSTTATAIESGPGRPGQAPSPYRSPSCVRAVTCRSSWSRAAPPRRPCPAPL